MPGLYPGIEPYDHDLLDVGDGHLVYWEQCGNPQGKPAIVVHGGPGSGCTPWQRMLFDPQAYRIVLFDQRNCGRSTPHASEPNVDLSTNTTHHLLADIERLRAHVGVDRCLVLGGSWGSTVALAYATAHPDRVSELVLFGVTTGRHSEIDWLFRGGVSMFFPEQWERLKAGLPEQVGDAGVPAAYNRLLFDSNPAVRQKAAEDWCLWESATPAWPPKTGLSPRFRDPKFALAFARIVTHYMRHDVFLEDGVLLRDAHKLAGIPGVLINGRFDFQSPLGNAWTLQRAWPGSQLVVVDNAGHAAAASGITREIVRALDRFSEVADATAAEGGR